MTGSDRSGGWSGYMGRNPALLRHTVPQENFDILEYPFLTMSKYPQGFIAHLGNIIINSSHAHRVYLYFF